MIYLFAVSLLWAVSFGLIGNRLAGVDPSFVAVVRLGVACLLFLPFLRRGTASSGKGELLAIGAVQFGVMYVSYIRAYEYLPSHLVALFTVVTPIYVVLTEDLLDRSFRGRYLMCALIAVVGALILRGRIPRQEFWVGFLLLQVANVAFGGGQVWYRRWRRRHPAGRDQQHVAWLYLGAVGLATSAWLVDTGPAVPSLSWSQAGVLLYLGVVASGVGFWLWNRGATRVSAGTLAAFNNAVVPLAVFSSLFLFGEADGMSFGDVVRLVAGGGLVGVGILLGRSQGDAGAVSNA